MSKRFIKSITRPIDYQRWADEFGIDFEKDIVLCEKLKAMLAGMRLPLPKRANTKKHSSSKPSRSSKK